MENGNQNFIYIQFVVFDVIGIFTPPYRKKMRSFAICSGKMKTQHAMVRRAAQMNIVILAIPISNVIIICTFCCCCDHLIELNAFSVYNSRNISSFSFF